MCDTVDIHSEERDPRPALQLYCKTVRGPLLHTARLGGASTASLGVSLPPTTWLGCTYPHCSTRGQPTPYCKIKWVPNPPTTGQEIPSTVQASQSLTPKSAR